MTARIADILVKANRITEGQRASAERLLVGDRRHSFSAQLVSMDLLTIAQRLARRICLIYLDPELLVSAGMEGIDAAHSSVFRGTGCSKCAGTGYKGRIALYETMTISVSLRELSLRGASSADLKRQAIQE